MKIDETFSKLLNNFSETDRVYSENKVQAIWITVFNKKFLFIFLPNNLLNFLKHETESIQ